MNHPVSTIKQEQLSESARVYYNATGLFKKVARTLRLYWLYSLRARARSMSASPALSILMVVPEVDRIGGYETQALQLASSLAGKQIPVTILSDTSNSSAKRLELRNGFAIRRMIRSRLPGDLIKALKMTLYFIRRRRNFNVVHVHGVTGFTLFAVRLARWLKLPSLIKPATHGDLQTISGDASFKGSLYMQWLAMADRFVAISGQIQAEVAQYKLPTSGSVRIPNFVDTELFKPATPILKKQLRTQLQVLADELVFLFLGRLEKRKGVEYLLHAWKQVPTGVLWIVGDGPERAQLQQMVMELNLERVKFFGRTSTPVTYYQSANIFVFPSQKEGFPNALLEAMSCGLACIATRIGGVTDIIDDNKDGLLVDPASANALAHAMNGLLQDTIRIESLGSAAAQKARSMFHIDKVTQTYIDLYTELRR